MLKNFLIYGKYSRGFVWVVIQKNGAKRKCRAISIENVLEVRTINLRKRKNVIDLHFNWGLV